MSRESCPGNRMAQHLVERGIAPIKAEYIKPQAEEEPVHVVGSVVQAAMTQVHKRSKAEEKKERNQSVAARLCFRFARGECQRGSTCKFSHDLDAFLASRPPDLPGPCPFSCQSGCPYGMLCRWATQHSGTSSTTEQHPSSRANKSCKGSQVGRPSLVELPVPASISEPGNELPAAVRQDLRKRCYDFSQADAVLGKLGYHNSVAKRLCRDVGTSTTLAKRACCPRAGVEQRGSMEGDAVHQDRCCRGGPQGGVVQSGDNAAATPSDHDNLEVANRASAHGASSGDAARVLAPASTRALSEACRELAGTAMAGGAGTEVTHPCGVSGSSAHLTGVTQDVSRGCTCLGSEPATQSVVPLWDISAASNPGIDVECGRDCRRKLDFRGKLYCAPLTTTGNLPFRRIVKQFGCDITCGEMAMASNVLQGQASEWALFKRHPEENCFGVQICCSHPDQAAHCVQLVEDCCSVDFIDINMGCPIDLVCDKGAGASLLQRPTRMEQIVRAAAAAAPSCAITFKTRTAYHDKQLVAHKLLPRALGWGACAVTLHGRSRQQRYTRSADWEYIRDVAAAAPEGLQVIGNGDIFSYQDFHAHMQGSEVATCMIARGALVKPWIFTEIHERRHWDISASERLEVLKKFVSNGLLHWGSDAKGVENTRRFLLEWLSFLHRYIPVGLLEVVPQQMTWRPPRFVGRSDLETLFASSSAADWVRISEMMLGPAPPGFRFAPRHKSNAYVTPETDAHEHSAGEQNQG